MSTAPDRAPVGDHPVRRALLDAGCAGPPPDPLRGLTFKALSDATGVPSSTISSRFAASDEATSVEVLRGEVYRDIIARFDRRPSRAIHDELTAALRQAGSLATVIAALGRGLAHHVAAQPCTPWVLGAASRGHLPGVSEDLRTLWLEFGSDVAALIETIVAARGSELDLKREELVSAVNTAVATGWLNTTLACPPRPDVALDGATFDPTGLVLWVCLRRRVQPPAAASPAGGSR